MAVCGVTIFSENLSGLTANVTFYPCSGGTISLGDQVFPFNYVNDYYFGQYDCYVPLYDYNYILEIPCPSPTPTVTTTPTITPTPTFVPLNLELFVEYSPGSIIASYTLLLNRSYGEEINVTFENVLNVYSGSPITIFTGVTVSSGSLSGQTIVTVDEDYNNYTGEPFFSQLSGTPSGSTYEIFVNQPTPTPTSTQTPTPTPTTTTTTTPTPTATTTTTPTPTLTPTPTPFRNFIISNLSTRGATITDVTPVGHITLDINYTYPVTSGQTVNGFHTEANSTDGLEITIDGVTGVPVVISIYEKGVLTFTENTITPNPFLFYDLTQNLTENDLLEIILTDDVPLTPTPTPTTTPTLTPTTTTTPSPTPTPQVLIEAILISPDEYLSVGDNEYLQY